jgi:hypothetical protein
MKRIILTLLILASVMIEGIAQEKLKIGDMVNGKLKMTNEAGLRSFMLNNMSQSGILDKEIRTEVSPTADRVFAYSKVTGNKSGITSVGVLLVRQKNEVFIVAVEPDSQGGPGVGGSATVTCSGNPCTQCLPVVDWVSGTWIPVIVCECQVPGGHCNQSVTITVSINIGF